MFYVYIIQSKKDKDLYIGSTNNLKRRLLEHNNGLNHSTKFRVPFELVYCEIYKSEEDARRREHNLKLRRNAFSQLKQRISKSLKTN
jgi:putative endonuclease